MRAMRTVAGLKKAARHVQGWVAFWRGVTVER
jgi:hypothetical protein